MKFTLIFTLSMIAQTVLYGQATTLFSQDFSSSTNLTDYQSATPNSGQFNQIGVNPTAINPTTIGSISSQKLFYRVQQQEHLVVLQGIQTLRLYLM